MIAIESVAALREALGNHRRAGARVAFVPTMGNLHAGHLKLVEEAKRLADVVVVSIYVNPLQFGPKEDLAAYPRTPDTDRQQLEQLEVDLLFMPTDKDIYPRGPADTTRVEVPGLGKILCGVSRPTHFAGVTTVVNRLFNLVQPAVAVFGKKDYQQLLIVQRMVSDLGMPIEIAGVDTVRESDGLAMSSRNGYLSNAERKAAPALYQALVSAAQSLTAGTTNVEKAIDQVRKDIEASGFRTDYVEIRRQTDLGEPAQTDRQLVLLVAGWLGRTRLIDNIEFTCA